jgi:hypothetical protein
MDKYAKIDHAALGRNLNGVCYELGRLIDGAGLYCGPPALTHENVEDDIPLALHKIAVAAGWIEESVELEVEDLESGRGDFLGNVIVEDSYKIWFLGLVSDALSDLKARASKNEEVQERHLKWLKDQFANGTHVPQKYTATNNPARQLIEEFWAKSQTVHDIQGLVDAATNLKPDGDKYPVSRSSVSRICNGYGAGPKARLFVAMVVNELVRCHKDDLKGTRKPPKAKKSRIA